MELSIQTIEILSVIAVIAGFLSAIAGSSGMIILPALLLTGMPPQIALGTNKLYTTASLLSSAIYFMRKGLFKPKYWIGTILAAAVGAIFGVILIQVVSIDLLEKLLPIAIALIAIYLIFPPKKHTVQENPVQIKRNTPLQCIGSVLLGVYSGFIGAGTGAIWTSLAMRILKLDMIEASALSRFMCFVTNLVALSIFIAFNEVDYLIGIDLAVCGALGAWLGSRLAIGLGSTFVRIVLIVFTFSMAINLALKSWFCCSIISVASAWVFS